MLSYIEISKENLLHNFQLFRKLVSPDTRIASLVKANAYGHGMPEVVQVLDPIVDCFQIDDLLELQEIRKHTKKPVMVFGYVAKDELEAAVHLDGTLAIYDEERVKLLDEIGSKLGRKVSVHVKVDANLGRQGILPQNAQSFAQFLKTLEHISVEGIYAHFANIEDTTDFSHAQKQLESFSEAVHAFVAEGFSNLQTHISASSGILVWEQDHGKSNMVRLGISQYGMWPSVDLQKKHETPQFQLKPVLRWVSHVAQVKMLPAGHSIGYGLTYVTEKPMKVAVIPQGYSDGFDRGLSNVGEVLIYGTRCKVLGRVAMNMFVVDVSHLNDVKAEDEVVLLGQQGNQCITAEEIADKIGTINYEVTTRILTLLPRVII